MEAVHIFHKSKSNPKILGIGRVTGSKFQTKDPHVLGATVKQNVVVATWRPGLVHP